MPSKVNERGHDREERRRHRSSRPKRKSTSKDDQDGLLPERSSTLADSSTHRKTSMPIPELQRRPSSVSPNGSRASLPYPSFSKAHSREAIGSNDNLPAASKKDIPTPDPTDLEQRDSSSPEKTIDKSTAPEIVTVNVPPSPPLTANDQTAVIEDKRQSLERQGEEISKKMNEVKENKPKANTPSRTSSARASPLSAKKGTGRSATSRRSRTGTPVRPKVATVEDSSSVTTRPKSRSPSTVSTSESTLDNDIESTVDSESTSVTPTQYKPHTPFTPDADDESSPTTDSDSSPKTPTPRGTPFPVGGKQSPVYAVQAFNSYGTGSGESPMPPPPPPPPFLPFQAPRVDYLMQNGGLSHNIPKTFLSAPEPVKVSNYTIGELPNPTLMAAQVEKFFSPFSTLLNDYTKVMAKSGSIAVATGYRSIARRLLDRLEAVFARDISSEDCACLMCDSNNASRLSDERGVSWGEILEYVSGRQELPPWPPFVLDYAPVGLGILADEFKAPMQKLDIDIPEEYRDHYVRQSKKTKQVVDSWLRSQSNDNSSPPDEADDDTLTFAILTHLDPEKRPIFGELLGVSTSRPPSIHPGSRTQTPLNAPKSELLSQTSLAVQRLYRLINPPRAPECALFLLNNQSLHNVLATLAAISDGEWEILTSGRFDGFLRSGAEEGIHPSIAPSRGPTPANGWQSRGPTPVSGPGGAAASHGAPVALDEETEIAVLAEVEREIYLGMETLEDAFEALHVHAECVRRALRERGAGLQMASQSRRGGDANVVEARLGTPASARGWESETDDGIDDALSELAPDDSASNVSSSRHRRPKRRTERRTPAPIDEEDEGQQQPAARISWSRNSIRRK